MKEKWKFEPITIKDEVEPRRMVCYHKDFERLRKTLIEDIADYLGSIIEMDEDEYITEAENIVNAPFGVENK